MSVSRSIGLCRNRKVLNGAIRLLHSSGIGCEQPDFEEKERQKKIDVIRAEMEIEKQSGNFFVPNEIKDKYWEKLVNFKDPVERRSFYRYLKEIELENENKKRRRDRTIQKQIDKLAQLNSKKEHIKYGPGENSLFTAISHGSLSKIYTSNLLHAVMFGQKIVFDMGYKYDMSCRELRNTMKQIERCYGAVRRDRDAFHVHFCNIPPDGRIEKLLKKSVPILQKPDPLMVVTQSSYLDHFPKEKLVYIVPNWGIDLEYNHDDVYIIGGIANDRCRESMLKAKVKHEGLRMARFPLDKYLKWNTGNKALSLDQNMKILITMKNTNDWLEAFKHVPARKLCVANEDLRASPNKCFWKD